MRSVRKLHRFVSASGLSEVPGLREASAWRYDRHILLGQMPPPILGW